MPEPEEKVEAIPEEPASPIVDDASKLKMEFPNPNTLGSPIITAESAIPDEGKRVNALDNF